jgi:hypothetical protein
MDTYRVSFKKKKPEYEPPLARDLSAFVLHGQENNGGQDDDEDPSGLCIQGSAPSSGNCNFGILPNIGGCSPGDFVVDICSLGSIAQS